jgi:hypothetical protein
VTGFRSIRQPQELLVEPDLTVLAGRNNVGKTALLQALTLPTTDRPGWNERFQLKMRWAVAGDDLRTALHVSTWPIGEVTSRFVHGNEFELECRVEPVRDPETLPDASQEVFGDSVLVVGRKPTLQVSAARIDGGVVALARKHSRMRACGHATFTWEEGTDPLLREFANVPGLVFDLCSRLLTSVVYVGPRRASNPRVELGEAGEMSPDGTNLTSVLADLYINHRRTVYPRVEDLIRSAFPEIVHVDVHVTRGTPALAEIYIVYPGEPPDEVPLEHCGTGIEQLLILGTAILGSPHRVRTFLIDEPHAFLHPQAERSLLGLIRQHPEHQFIVATHSPIFLRTTQLHRVRLLRREAPGTVIRSFGEEAGMLLIELGMTADDAWSGDAILWVEGQTEVEIYSVLGENQPDLLGGVRVKSMPDSMRAARLRAREIDRVVTLVRSVSEALRPFGVRTLFLFDPDEVSEARKRALLEGTAGSAMFQPCREVENLLLDASCISAVLNRRGEALGLSAVSEEAVSRHLEELMGELTNPQLYPPGTSAPDAATVRGSRVLTRLFASFGNLEYDAVRDARAIVWEIIARTPGMLNPLRAAVEALKRL